MEWQTPQFLYLILPLCLSWLGLALYSEKRRQLARDAFIAHAMQDRILPPTSRIRFLCKLVLFEIALTTGLIALAGPRFGMQVEQVVPRGSDLYVLIDVSRSMLADDVVPSRLERAKADISSLVNRLSGERIGLIAFAGKAVVKCPLTIDYDSFRRALMELDPNSAPRGGTAIGDAIRKAVEVFHAGTQRDQTVLLITDGDDQESFPLEAATVAAERKVTVFTVGLGDSNSGARVPGQSGATSFMEHEGQQVWSKLNGSLLSDIALKTNGVYIPAGTRSYDLGELYAQHLQGRTGDPSETQQRIRKSERFQIFLGTALLALLVDLCIGRYSNTVVRSSVSASESSVSQTNKSTRPERTRTSSTSTLLPAAAPTSSKTLPLLAGISFGLMSGQIEAGESPEQVREGLRHYQAAEYYSAGKLFAAATEELDKSRSSQAAIAAFDEACALHRKGDKEKARERYLKAGLSPDKTIATASHYNLGTLSAENARSIAGENPENAASEDRQKILDELKQAVASYRHALELNPEHQASRRNLELVRTWIKYYSDRWDEIDRQKRRDESNLIQFLEFLMTTQNALKQSVQQLPENAPSDVYAQLKKNQDELAGELPFLREKIEMELQPQGSPPGAQAPPKPLPPEVKEGIEMLQSWSDKAANEMQAASSQLFKAKPADAVAHQQEAVSQLDQIWDAVIPFHPLLAKELGDQTAIADQLAPHGATSTTPETSQSADSDRPDGFVPISPALDPAPAPAGGEKTPEATTLEKNTESNDPQTKATPLPSDVTLDESTIQLLREQQSTALRKARLLAPKAQAELSRLEVNPSEAAAARPIPATPPNASATDQNAAPHVDPEKLKQGLLKAVELSPKAVEAMQLAVDHLQRKDPNAAAAPAEEARRILEEIQNAQPEQPQQDQKKEDQKEQDQKEQKKDDQSQKNDEQQDQKKKKDDANKKSPEQKQDSKDKQNQKKQDETKQDKKNEEQKKQSDQKKDDKQQQNKDKSGNKSGDSKDKTKSSGSNSEQPQFSPDRIEDALRKVRERQQEKRERDREMRARIIGRTPVERDW